MCDNMKTSNYDEPCEEEEDAQETQYESYETSIVESYKAPVEQKYEVFKKCRKPVTEVHEQIIESSETQVVESFTPVANVTHQETTYTSNEPPPVPKRTILPNNSAKEKVAPETTPQKEIALITEEADTQNVYRDIELVSPEEGTQKTETGAERWSDSTSVSLPGQVEDIETVSSDPGNAQCEPVSEMYYTASSEVSLLSDTELVDKVHNENNEDDESKDDRKNVIAGHVAAMRERFESMTRTNTPCPDLIRSLSPSLEVFRTTSPSPDRLS